MAIAKRPKRNFSDNPEERAEAFINGAGKAAKEEGASTKKPLLVRMDQSLIERIDKAAKRLGISRAAFIVSSAARELERME